MPSPKASKDALAALACIPAGINGYSDAGQDRKDALHTQGKAFLKRLAGDLGLRQGEFDLRSNLGGIAVSGEVTLHADHLYVQLSESSCGSGGVSVLYRSCSSRKDFCGDRNNSASIAQLQSGAYNGFVARCASLMKEAFEREHANRPTPRLN